MIFALPILVGLRELNNFIIKKTLSLWTSMFKWFDNIFQAILHHFLIYAEVIFLFKHQQQSNMFRFGFDQFTDHSIGDRFASIQTNHDQHFGNLE